MRTTEDFQAVRTFGLELAQRAQCSPDCFTITTGYSDREYCLHWYVSPSRYKRIGTYTVRVGHNGLPLVMNWDAAAGFFVLATDTSFSAECAP